MRRGRKWIAGALGGVRGSLARKLGHRTSERVPGAELRAAARRSGKTGRQARFALTMRKLAAQRRAKHKAAR